MNAAFGRTRNFHMRISIERKVLANANLLSERLSCEKLFGLSNAAIDAWLSELSRKLPGSQVAKIEHAVKELARATGLLSDESRCAVSEGKVSADFPELLAACEKTIGDVQ